MTTEEKLRMILVRFTRTDDRTMGALETCAKEIDALIRAERNAVIERCADYVIDRWPTDQARWLAGQIRALKDKE